MSFQPSPLQTLILWRLLTNGGQAYQGEIRPELKKRDRDALEQAGFIEHDRRRNSKGRQAIYIQLTDKAWAWAGEHMHAELSSGSKAASPIFQAFLTKLQPVLQQHQIPLAEIFSPTEIAHSQEPEQQLREAYFALSEGKPNVRVRLAQLRQRLTTLPRSRLDTLLLQLQTEGKLVLYPLDDPQEISPEDREAALDVAGFERHIVYLQK
jgi:DNA-binding PadR family transcriptional regulator